MSKTYSVKKILLKTKLSKKAERNFLIYYSL